MAGQTLLQSAATTGNGNEWDCRGVPGTYQLEIVGAGTISAGALQWEQAQSAGYSGTWAPLAIQIAPIDAVLTVQQFTGAPRFVRCRFVSDVTGGGTATVKMRVPLEMNT